MHAHPELRASAFLFDMDGTLVDSTPVVERIWRGFASRFGLDASDILRSCHGVRMVDTVRRFAPIGSDVERLAEELAQLELADDTGIRAIPGAAQFLASLRETKTAVVSSAAPDLLRARMLAANLSLPRVVVTAEDVEHGKPSPECYLLAAARLEVNPANCLVFEDADVGIRAGHAAGMQVVVIGKNTAHGAVGDYQVDDFTSLVASVDEATGDVRLGFRMA